MQLPPSEPSRPNSAGRFADAGEFHWYFGAFTVWEQQRRLEKSGQPVRVGPRSFDLLLHLIRHAGEFVSKDELLAAVWNDVVVEEASVRVHMSLLRKALGKPEEDDNCKEWITTIPLRGYRFNGKVAQERIGDMPRSSQPAKVLFTRLPVRWTELVGREAEVKNALDSLTRHRLVTIVGPGGIGKTSVAIQVAERWHSAPDMQIAFVDLAPLISPDHVLSTLARALGVSADLPDPIQAITDSLAGMNVLLLIDNCEHVLNSLAAPVTRLLTAVPGLRILATSRETLRVAGEFVLRLSALAVPDAETATLSQALEWSAVELLVERAKAAGAGVFDEDDGPLLVRISRQLDGIPLAIELVAASLGVQSLADLALRLENHMRLLCLGNRATEARHQTLAAALDWSIALLDQDELRVFRRLSVFRDRFDVASALGVTSADLDQDTAFDALISLANKSLVSFDSDDAIAPYRLLDTTRSYAATLLEKSGERPALLRRHGQFMLDLMKQATTDLPNLTEQAWGDRYAHHLDDVRFALKASLTEQADARIAAALAEGWAPLWSHLSQVAEYRDQVAAALKLVEQQSQPDPGAETELLITLIIAILHTDGLNPGLEAACDRALAGALALKAPALELRARWAHCVHDIFRGEYTSALQHSRPLLVLAQSWGEPAALNLAHRVSAMANHFDGRFALAKQHSEAALDFSVGGVRTRTNMVGVDPTVAAKATLSRTLWIQGDSENAIAMTHEAVGSAQSSGHAVSLCAALFGACPVALWSGQLELASRWVRMMMEEAQRKGLVGWLRHAQWYAQGLQLAIANERSDTVKEISGLFADYDAPRKEMLLTFCGDLLDEHLLQRIDAGEGLWIAAEVSRERGRRSEQRGRYDEAESFYRRAIEIARQQGARAWEWRAALSLARMWVRSERAADAMRLLDEVGPGVAANNPNPALQQIGRLRAELAAGSAASPPHKRTVGGKPRLH